MNIKALIAAAALLLGGLVQASPVGLWKTIDDASKKEKSLVRITEQGGVLSGRIEKLLDPQSKPDAVCDKCSDERKGQPIVGLTIIRNVRQNADDASVWDGGDILDPNNGKVYRVRLKPVDGGKTLEVRGYIGAPLLGRTQIWQRVE
ncbi:MULTISPECIES: DUF2147 domain-containing protein [Caldimonas]|uniref:DUF2147 domain-containing protein n=1 Tax=Caldimonas TaxID=196013 RepID=UPI0003827F0E|nr:DUF2147 domain-containing protein [Caldimonas manganoxidans]MCX7660700.1 DUF2147 domain-containing protein [Caldimonas manganoxidans]GIX24193.1 MAG: hypothetical protein KatS3mg122_1424 [Caldimonas sp.]